MSDVQTTQLSPREAQMEAIANQRRTAFTAETGIALEHTAVPASEDDDPDDATAEAERARLAAIAEGRIADPGNPAGEEDPQLAIQREQEEEQARLQREQQEEAAAATARASQNASAIDPAAKVKIKVRGVEREITGEELLRRAQKDVNAEEQLAEARRLRAETEELQRQLQQQQQQPATRAAAPNTGDVVIDDAVVNEFTSALFAGDEGKAAAAFKKAVGGAVEKARAEARGRGDATPIDPNAIADQVQQRIEVNSALARSRRDYPQLYADRNVETLASLRVREKIEEEGMTFSDAVDAVGEDLAKTFGWKKATQTPPAPQPNRRTEALERKQGLEQPPRAATAKSTTEEEPPRNVHSTIAEMARGRPGQSAY